jgi:hypothetical protein
MTLRNVYVGIRATEREHAAWKSAAKSDGRSVSAWIVRRCNGQSATAPMLEPEEPSPKAPPKTRKKR